MATQVVKGIHLPADDTHFKGQVEANPLFDGRGTYQFNKVELAIPQVKQFRRAVDVGAHVGLWTRVLAKKFKFVHAFEPVQAHLECFELNLKGQNNVELHRVALGDRVGSVNIQTTPENSGNAHVAKAGLPVNLQTLDSVLDWIPDLDFIKIDVEGFEQAVVLGGERLIKKFKPTMVVEQKGSNAERAGFKTGSVIDLLKGWGYKEVWVRSGDHCLVGR